MITYEEKVDFIVYCLSELAVEKAFMRDDNKEIIDSLYNIIEGNFPLVWDFMPLTIQEFYVTAAVNIMEFKIDLLNEQTENIDNYIETVSNDLLEFVAMAAASAAMITMEPVFFAFDYESLQNKVGVCRKLKGSRRWKCQLGALKAARASARSSMGRCRNKPNPLNCEKKSQSAIERIDKNIEKIETRLKAELNSEHQLIKIQQQRAIAKRAKDATGIKEAFDADWDSDEDPFAQIKKDLKKGAEDKVDWVKQNKLKAAKNAGKMTAGASVGSVGMRLTKSFLDTRKVLDVARVAQGAGSATKAVSLGVKTANLTKNAAKLGGVSIAATLLRKATIAVLSRKRMDVCDRNFDGSEKHHCRMKAIDGSVRELRKILSSCGTDKKCKDKLNKALLTAMKQRATAKVKYDEARVYERNQ